MENCESPPSNENRKIYSSLMKAESYLDSHIPNIRWDVVLIILWIILVVLNFCRLFYNYYWWDECYTILLSHESLDKMMYLTEYHDANPPLYYLILKSFCLILGFEPFVYNFVSYLPYLLMMILFITIVRKRFGIAPAAIMMIFASIFEKSQYYITEVRAYQWTMFFLLVMIILCYEIIKNPKIWHYVSITIVYVCACYTHYYGLMCGGAILSAMVIRGIVIKDKKEMILSFSSILISFIAFLPWIPFFLKETNDVANDFWIEEIPSIPECIIFMFSYNPVSAVFTFFLIITAIFLAKKMIKNSKKSDLLLLFHLENEKWSTILVALCGIFGLLLFTTAVSYIKNPMLFLRYVYPISVIAWMVVAIYISGIRTKKLFTVITISLTLVIAIPLCSIWMYDEYQTNANIVETLDLTYPHMREDDDILTDQTAILGEEGDYYYPGIPKTNIEPSIADISHDKQHWLFLKNEINSEIIDNLSRNGFDYQTIKENGNIGPYVVWVYKLI